MLKYLVPRIAWSDLPPMFGIAIGGAVIAGLYGVLHDQITYTIGPEYFTKLKFRQFHWADLGFGDRFFVSCIGFLATWWVGFIVAWFLARRLVPGQPRGQAFRRSLAGFGIVIACGLVSGASGYVYGIWCGPDGDYSDWQSAFQRFGIIDGWAFVRVAWIHNMSYLGGVIGLVTALVLIRPGKSGNNQPAGSVAIRLR